MVTESFITESKRICNLKTTAWQISSKIPKTRQARHIPKNGQNILTRQGNYISYKYDSNKTIDKNTIVKELKTFFIYLFQNFEMKFVQ